jgi:uncharacterized membrane protein YhiD involved in acid resistance
MTRNTRQIVFVALGAALAGFLIAALFWSVSRTDTRQQNDSRASNVALTADNANARLDNANARLDNTNARRADEVRGGETRERGVDENRRGEATADRREADGKEGSSVGGLFGAGQGAGFAPHEPWTSTVPRILLRLALATALAAMLAFRPRRNAALVQRNLYVAQTQILIAVVASALMMVVGDNAARAFGIFAAASLVRFRTNIRDPKEITVLLISLAVGLATGVGRIDVAVVLALFVLPLLWLLEHREDEQVFRSMELSVKARDIELAQGALEAIFRRHRINAEVRQINPPAEGEPAGCVMYYVQMSLNTSTDAINDEIMAADPGNVESIEWEQQKSRDYIYQ